MRYGKLGNIGLIVSGVALGTMQFGGRMNVGNLGQEDTTRMVKLALDGELTLSTQRTCTASGRARFLSVRNEIVLATKVRLPMSENFNRSGATRVNIVREMEGSLQRLQTDYIDLYQVHGWGQQPGRSRRHFGRSTILSASGKSAISGCPTSCPGRQPLRPCCKSA
jgi:aryl-alcohol dehydrogenase-like predicted oxidoreductase